METVTIRELRQNWPEVEKRLTAVGEITVTRDGAAVASLLPPSRRANDKPARRFDASAHAVLMRKIWGDQRPSFTTAEVLAAERAERVTSGPSP